MKLLLVTLFLALVGCQSASSPKGESALDRVRHSHTLRCGYAEWPKYLEKDPVTGNYSGIFAEFMEEVGKSLGVKIVWTEPVSFGDIAAALEANKFDAVCSGIWPVSARAQAMTFTRPIAYSPGYAWIRADDTRITSVSVANDPAFTVATIDGEYSEFTRQRLVPKSREHGMPKSADGSELLLALVSKKADITFTDVGSAERFIKSHPGSIRRVSNSEPVSSLGNSLALKKGEWELKETLDVVTEELLWNGTVDLIIKKYEQFPNEFLRAQAPFKEK